MLPVFTSRAWAVQENLSLTYISKLVAGHDPAALLEAAYISGDGDQGCCSYSRFNRHKEQCQPNPITQQARSESLDCEHDYRTMCGVGENRATNVRAIVANLAPRR